MYSRWNPFRPRTSRSEDFSLAAAGGIVLAAYELFLRSLLVDAAKRHRESGIGRISAAAQDHRALCGFAVGPSRHIGSADTCASRASTRVRKEQRRRGAEERDQKEARGTHNPSPGAPRQRATKSVLGLCVIPVIRFSPLVLIVAS